MHHFTEKSVLCTVLQKSQTVSIWLILGGRVTNVWREQGTHWSSHYVEVVYIEWVVWILFWFCCRISYKINTAKDLSSIFSCCMYTVIILCSQSWRGKPLLWIVIVDVYLSLNLNFQLWVKILMFSCVCSDSFSLQFR